MKKESALPATVPCLAIDVNNKAYFWLQKTIKTDESVQAGRSLGKEKQKSSGNLVEIPDDRLTVDLESTGQGVLMYLMNTGPPVDLGRIGCTDVSAMHKADSSCTEFDGRWHTHSRHARA